ncbi:MAG: hypothetical protein KDK70_20530, partial [Myxococcales bacterium]|nr:hypothetical protein [Myxococcales bacterium]
MAPGLTGAGPRPGAGTVCIVESDPEPESIGSGAEGAATIGSPDGGKGSTRIGAEGVATTGWPGGG